jgi:7-cyano-7-deazaguanine synthase in queuosine biosynthesis
VTRALFLCDGAAMPTAFESVKWQSRDQINHQGPSATLNLRVENLSHALLARIDARAADLVRIGAYVYAADQSISRGGPKDVYGAHWRRQFGMAIPVGDPAFWNRADVAAQLAMTLNFLSDDTWEFSFSEARPGVEQLVFSLDDKELLGNPDSVILFSGGADSLCATVDAVSVRGLRPVLVSHRPAPSVDAQQKRLVAELRQRFDNWDFPQVSIWVHRKGRDASETSQRTRAFLFASLGAAIAAQLGLSNLLLADNGVTSVNLPISAQLVGALASRSTHPRFVRLFHELLAMLFAEPIVVSNPLWSSTRTEALENLKRAGVADLLQETNSCAHRRGRSRVQPHCGTCSQCIDRRFASIAAGLEEHDLPERYEVDIFHESIPEGTGRTLAESYVRFALKVHQLPDEGLFLEFPELYECVEADDAGVEKTASELVHLVQRHASSTISVMETQVARHSRDLVAGALPPACLIRLVASGAHLEDDRLRVIRTLTSALVSGLPPIYRDRPPRDEREVQNAVDGIASALQMDLRREVPLLPFAGISTKPDFANIPQGGRGWLFIEMKYPAVRARVNGIVTEITSRARIYRKQDAFVLFAVYDPQRHIVYDEQFKEDCGQDNGVWVEVVR